MKNALIKLIQVAVVIAIAVVLAWLIQPAMRIAGELMRDEYTHAAGVAK